MENRRKILPPAYLLMTLVFVFLVHLYFPMHQYIFPPLVYAGIVPVILGISIAASSSRAFKQAETSLVPFDEATMLVTSGFYRFTRNPMYLGMLSVLLGCAVTVGSTCALAVPVLFGIIIELRFIRPEEAMLRELFPEDFAAYCERVRRWL